ncbi:MAG: hypothetical protein R2824_23110 [Saprospiraceae bacterium]
MKKDYLFLLLTLFCSVSLMGQRIKDERIEVQFLQLPSSPLNPEFTTYRVTVSGPASTIEDMGSTRESLGNAVKLDGFKRMDSAPAHFTIALQLGVIRVEGQKDHKRSETKKDKNDKEYTVTYYSKSVSYSQPFSYRIYDFEGNVLDEKIVSSRTELKHWKSREFESASTLNRYLADQYKAEIYDLQKKNIREFLGKVNGEIRFKYDFQLAKDQDQLFVLNKKEDGADEFMQAYETVNTAFASMRPEESLDEIRTAVAPALEIWRNAKDRYSSTDKKEKKGHFACLYNLAKVYYWLDDAEAAMTAVQALQEVDYKDGKSDRFEREIKQLTRLLEVNKVDSRHFDLKLDQAVPPPTAKELAALEEAEAAAEAMTQYEGFYVNADGDTLDGVFFLDLEAGPALIFGQNSNIYFQPSSEGEAIQIDLEATQAFAFNDRQFEVMTYTPGAKGNTESGRHLLEILYAADRIRVLRHYPFDASGENEQVEYAYQKQGQELPVSTLSTEFLIFRKGLANYFSDCADLVSLANEGELKQDEPGIIRAARIYGEMCE